MQAEEELSDGLSVVVDGTFLKQEWRDKALQVAQACGAEAIFVECSCPDEVARLRIAKRLKDTSNLSQARPEFYDRQVADREQLATNATSCKVDTTVSAPLMLKTVFNHVSKTLATKA